MLTDTIMRQLIKKWFDETYPDITIYDSIYIKEHRVVEKKFVTCSSRTKLIVGYTIIEKSSTYL